MTHTCQRASQRFTDVIHEVMVLQSSVAQTGGKDYEVGQEVTRPERLRVDVNGAQDGRVFDAREQSRVQRYDLVH